MPIYIYLPDPDAHRARAKAAGAEMVTEPHDHEDYPGRGHDACDAESYVWGFGRDNPWA